MAMFSAAPSALTLRDDPRRSVLTGLAVTLVLGVVLVGWAATTMIGGAVVAAGQIAVRGKAQVVQTLDGGEVAQILVHDGARVAAGDVLVRLDPTLAKVNLDMALGRLSEALTRRARLEAEHLGLAELAFVYHELPFALPDLSRQEAGQRQIFQARAEVLHGQRDQLTGQKEQTGHQIEGLTGQLNARKDQLALIEADLANMRDLVKQGLARRAQMTDLQRQDSELQGQIATLEADLARLGNTLQEAELKALQAERAFKEEVVTELREATALVEELTLEILTRQDQLARVEIRAPAAGTVHQMQVATVGGVLAPGAVLLEVIPQMDGLDFEVQVAPRNVAQVHPGQQVEVMMSALPSRTTPRLVGKVTAVSPDAILDQRTGQAHYQVKLTISDTELARLGQVDLIPGMPIEAFLQTGERSVMEYLIAPLAEQIRHAFRET